MTGEGEQIEEAIEHLKEAEHELVEARHAVTEAKARGGEAIGALSARQNEPSGTLGNWETLPPAGSHAASLALRPLLGDRRRLVEESVRREVWGDQDGDLLNLAVTLARLAAQRWVESRLDKDLFNVRSP